MIKPWPIIESKSLGDFRIFTMRSDKKVSPRTGREHDFVVLECRNWVNVIALTPDHRLVMVEQYRHGSDTVELEIPGGIMDPHDVSPVAAGLRELREETGYEGEHPELIGQVFANPAILNNTMYTVLVRNCHLRHELSLDQGEDITTHLVSFEEIPGLIASGRIGHSLVVAAFYHYETWRKRPVQE